MCGRCGDVAGAAIGIFLNNSTSVLVLSTSVAFVITIFLFMTLYQKIYISVLPEKKNRETQLEEFEKLYRFSPREIEVFQLVLEGHSNSEIAECLFISENTVKFHIKNLLRKTACTSKTSLVTLFKEQ